MTSEFDSFEYVEFDGPDISPTPVNQQPVCLYQKKYDSTTTEYYRVMRERKMNVILHDTQNYNPLQAFTFKYQWDPYTGERSKELDPYGPLYFHPDDLIRYFYTNRLNMLWTEPIDEGNSGYYYEGMYGDAVGAGENIYIPSRGHYPENYLFRLPIVDCYIEKNSDMSIVTMGPKLNDDELIQIENLANTYYPKNYKNVYKTPRPSLTKLKQLYDQAINPTPDISQIESLYKKLSIEELYNKANCLAVDELVAIGSSK